MKLAHALLAMTALVPVAAMAQDPNPQVAPGPEAGSANTGEIIVTARKRAESLQDVPVAITALDSNTLQSARVENLNDVAKLTPGLNYTPLFGRQNQLPIIRGVAQTLGQLNVGVFLDGVYLSGKAAVDLELNDLERVEVVKGPQSALYGRNTFAGAINYVTKRPTKDVTGRAEISGGDNGLFKVIGNVSGPLSDTVRVRVGAFYRKFDGFYTSGIDGGRVDFEKGKGVSGTLEWQPTEAFIATLRATMTRDDDGQPASNVIRNNAGLGFAPGSTFPGLPAAILPTLRRNLIYVGQLPSIPTSGVLVSTRGVNIQPIGLATSTVNGIATPNVAANFPGITFFGDREDSFRTSLTLQYDTGETTATSISSYAYRSFDYTYDGDNTICDRAGGCPNFGFPFAPAIPVGANQFGLSSSIGYFRDYSQEFRLQSSGDRRLNWLAGVFYYHNTNLSIDRSITPTLAAANAYFFPQQVVYTDSYSAFGSLVYKVTDALRITGELRYEHERQRFLQNPTNPAGSGTVAANVTNLFDLRQKFNFVTPRVIIDYRLPDRTLLYASYARGAKTGGFNTGANVFANQRTYNPEFANNYEVGVKTRAFNNALTVNAALFYIDWRNQQVVDQNPVTAGGSSTNRSYTANTAKTRIYGAELETTLRLADEFQINASYAYTNAKYRNFIDVTLNGTVTPPVAGLLGLAGLPNINFNGNNLPYVPKHKFAVSPVVTLPLGEASLEARADLQYQTRTYLRADNLAFFPQRTTVDLRVTGRLRNVYLQLFANNVFDNANPVAGVRFFDATNFSVSSPYVTGVPRRQLGAALGVNF